MPDRLDQANAILQTFSPGIHFERRQGRLWLVTATDAKAAVLNRSGCSLGLDYGRLGMGGTRAQATAQLVRYVRDLTRLPLSCWEYWTTPCIFLARDRGPEMLAALQATDYADPLKTACVLCGDGDHIGDWYSNDGRVGPLCHWNAGCKQRGSAPGPGGGEENRE